MQLLLFYVISKYLIDNSIPIMKFLFLDLIVCSTDQIVYFTDQSSQN